MKETKRNERHGMSSSVLYGRWSAMIQRCTNPKNAGYKSYGGRGISFDPRWKSFKNFMEDMSEGFKEELSLDRIDNDKGYSKENCRWVTMRQQNQNTSRNTFIDCEGEKLCVLACARKLGLHQATMYTRVYTGKYKIYDK